MQGLRKPAPGRDTPFALSKSWRCNSAGVASLIYLLPASTEKYLSRAEGNSRTSLKETAAAAANPTLRVSFQEILLEPCHDHLLPDHHAQDPALPALWSPDEPDRPRPSAASVVYVCSRCVPMLQVKELWLGQVVRTGNLGFGFVQLQGLGGTGWAAVLRSGCLDSATGRRADRQPGVGDWVLGLLGNSGELGKLWRLAAPFHGRQRHPPSRRDYCRQDPDLGLPYGTPNGSELVRPPERHGERGPAGRRAPRRLSAGANAQGPQGVRGAGCHGTGALPRKS